MTSMSVHDVEKIKLSEIIRYEKDSETDEFYATSICIEHDDGELDITLISDSKENLRI